MSDSTPVQKSAAADSAMDDQFVGEDEVGEWEKPGAGCRPCCSAPHGMRGVLTAILGTIAWVFTAMATNTCEYMNVNFLYCHPSPPPAEAYGTCGGCHCIAGENPCPTNPAEIPPTTFSKDLLDQLKFQKPTNPFKMLCNPYNTTGSCGIGHCGECTDPPQNQDQIELWETAVCGLKYNMSSLTDDYCPTEYEMITYDTYDQMAADGAQQTHWGACGPCSTSQDLTVYMENPDLTGKGQECGVRGLLDTQDGINCFMEAGYTAECSEAWMYNVFNTRDKCFDICVDFTFFGPGINAGPPPECRIADCLLCDEQMSGPIFQEVAARSRRRSGLLSKIARPCNVILIVNHTNPCDFVKEKMTKGRTRRRERHLVHQGAEVEIDRMGVARSSTSAPPPDHFKSRSLIYSSLDGPNPNQPLPAPYKWTPPVYNETCWYIKESLGLLSYAGTESNNWLFGDMFLSEEEKLTTSQYSTCYSYEFRNVLEGFWYNMKEILGPAYTAAKAFAIIATTLGGLALVFVWTTTCIAYPARFWKFVGGIFAACGLFVLLTLTFRKSDVCNGHVDGTGEGCTLNKGAAAAIVAGIFWFIASFFSFTTGPYKLEQETAACCCCPSTIASTGADPAAYSPVPTKEPRKTEVSIVETDRLDGTVVIEKTTTYPNGAKEVEVTTKAKKKEEESEKIEAAVAAEE